jgi:hypothetical protein
MKQHARLAVLLGVACAFQATNWLRAQEQKKIDSVQSPAKEEAKKEKEQARPDADGSARRPVKEAAKKEKGQAAAKQEAAPAPKAKVVTKKVQVIGPAVGGGVVIQPQPAQRNLKPMIQNQTEQFRTALWSEYLFAVNVCGLTKEQRRPIAIAGERALRDAAKTMVEWPHQPRRVGVGQNPVMPDPRKLIQEGLAAAVKANLSPELSARYREELEKRDADRKRVTVLNLIEKLDEALVLSADQRARLAESLSTHYNENWWGGLELYMNNQGYFPFIPNQFIVPILTDAQNQVWSGTQKIQVGPWNRHGLAQNLAVADEALQEAAKEEARKDDQEQDDGNG